MAEDVDVYKNMLSDLIKRQMIMLGPNVALGTARKVNGITVAEDGAVTAIAGDPRVVMEGVADAYMRLSGQIAQMTIKTILEKYPNIKQPGSSVSGGS